MPNYCENTTVVVGPPEDVVFFHTRVAIRPEGGEAHFAIAQNLLPLPPSASKVIEIGEGNTITAFSDTGYDLALALWGTKWGDFSTEFIPPDTYRYQTAWGPMEHGLRLVSLMFPTLAFATHWYEEDFHWGAFAYRAGFVLDEVIGGRLEMPPWPDDDKADAFSERWHLVLEETAAKAGQRMVDRVSQPVPLRVH